MKISHRIKNNWKRIQIIDKFLIVIMCVLITYSILSLNASFPDSEYSARLDIFVRTSIASIFGYFISSNFIKNEQAVNALPFLKDTSPIIVPDQQQDSSTIKAKIGFTFDTENEENPKESIGASALLAEKHLPSNKISANVLQIQIVGILCILSISVMVFIRFFGNIEEAGITTIAQFQDIICASIGFLIGMPAESSE